jgi:co-chaperonin GroES (HSP10)
MMDRPSLKQLLWMFFHPFQMFAIWRDARTFLAPDGTRLPRKWMEARSASDYPWRAFGWRICLHMFSGEDRVSKGGIVLPDVYQGLGKDKKRTTGLVIAIGGGDVVPGVGWVSPQYHYGVRVGDVLFIEPNCGHVIFDDENEYRIITPNDVIQTLRADYGANTYAKMQQLAKRALAKYVSAPDDAGVGTAPASTEPPMDRPDYEKELGEIIEMEKSAGGHRDRPGVRIPAEPIGKNGG